MTPFCLHGVPFSESTNEKLRLVLECNSILWDQFGEREDLDVEHEKLHALFMFWHHSSRSHQVDEELCKLYFAMATDYLLGEEPNREDSTRRLATMGALFKEMTEKGVATVSNEYTQNGQSRETAKAMNKLCTRDGLIRYLARAIPCSCLDEQLKEAKASPKVRECWFCDKEEMKVKLFKCSGCKIMDYCSKECQKADWKGHKRWCNMISKQES